MGDGRENRAEQGSFRKWPSGPCVKIAVCNWAPDVHRMYDCQVVKKKVKEETFGRRFRRGRETRAEQR